MAIKQSEQWPVCWVVALTAEARFLLDSYAFKRIKDIPFPLYHSQKYSMHLVITGIGKVNSAAATAWLGALLPPQSIWINFGTAGEQAAPIGRSYWIHKITDAATGHHYYPTVLPRWKSASLGCYDRPQHNPKQLVDMESSGFFPTARLFTHHELVQLHKVVSDNEQQPAQRLPATTLSQICAAIKPQLDLELSALRHLAHSQLNYTVLLQNKLADWSGALQRKYHFSANHLVQLRELLRQWFILRQDSPLDYPARNAAAFLKALRAELMQEPHH